MGDSDSTDDGIDGNGHYGRPSGVRMYLLLRLDRRLFTAAVLSIVFLVLAITSQLGLSPLRQIVSNQDGLEFLFSAFIGAIITGTSIVVTINQLVLSQELGAVGDQRERMGKSIEFREDVEDAIGEQASPPDPSAFLYDLMDGTHERANGIASAVERDHGEDVRTAVEEYVDGITETANETKNTLENAEFGTFEVIWYALTFDYSRKIYEGRQLRADYEDDLSSEASEAIDDTIEVMKFFGPAREHFKTLYFQWELINLSRALLYISVPALAVMAIMIMYVDANALPGTTLGIDNLVWLTSAGFVVGIAPFVVFTVYILRIASVAKRTLAMGPFILREPERGDD